MSRTAMTGGGAMAEAPRSSHIGAAARAARAPKRTPARHETQTTQRSIDRTIMCAKPAGPSRFVAPDKLKAPADPQPPQSLADFCVHWLHAAPGEASLAR